MLVLTRRAGESIMIGSDVAVRVIEVRGDVVRLGVDAPREVQVHREEVFNAVRAQNLAAAVTRSAQADALRADLVGQLAAARPRPRTAPPADGAPVTPGSADRAGQADQAGRAGPAGEAGPATAPRPVPSPPRPGPPPR